MQNPSSNKVQADHKNITDKAQKIIEIAQTNFAKIVVSESCTGGLISSYLTAFIGAASVLDRGYVTYSEAAKSAILNIPQEFITKFDVVSKEVAIAMAKNALAPTPCNISISVTGFAGPAPKDEPHRLGEVHTCIIFYGKLIYQPLKLSGDRDQIRLQTVSQIFNTLYEHLKNKFC